jgi:hypothetical protein
MAGLVACGAMLLWANKNLYLRLCLVFGVAFFAYEFNKYTAGYLNLKPQLPESAKNYYQETNLVRWLQMQNRIEQGQFRYVVTPTHLLSANLANYYELKSLLGYRSSKLMNFYRYLEGDWNYESPRYNRLALKYLITNEARQNLKEVFTDSGIRVYELPGALGVIYLENNGEYKLLPEGTKVTWLVNSVEIQLPSNFDYSNSKIYLGQPGFPSWRVMIDGQAQVLEQDDIFLYANLPSGVKNIKFYYSSVRIYLGMALSLLGLFLVFLLSKKGIFKS